MERESESRKPKAQSEFRGKLKTAIRVMRTFLWGVGFATTTYAMLLELRDPHSHLHTWMVLFPLILTVPDILSKEKGTGSGGLMGFILSLSLAGLFFMRTQDWAPVAAGAIFAIFFRAYSKSTKRPYLFLSAGSLFAGVFSLQFPWPNEQRCLVTLVGVGITASLQGLWIILSYYLGDRPAEFTEPVNSTNNFPDREMIRLIHLIFGSIGHMQIFSHDLEQRIRRRYQSEIDQLESLGFDYLFSDGETFSIFRLLLLFPALVLIMMRSKREVITIKDGTKVLMGYPVYISKNKTAYGYVSGLGTKFYTVFQDGTLLVSKAYIDGDYISGPMIRKYAKKASIGETWADHQQRIAELEAEGKRVDRQTSFQVYAGLSYKETAPW